MRNREVSLDIIRIVACILVVAMHSPVPSVNANGAFLSALSYLTAPCIGLFFMVSGALLLPVKEDYIRFINRRFGKVICPTLIWTAVYLCLKLYNDPERVNIISIVLSIPFSAQGHGVLWFMYTLAGLYLLAPIISPWLEKATKKDLQIVLCLWGITLCYPILEHWLIINEGNTGILYYFGGYAGYFLLGFYLKKYPQSLSLPVAVGFTIIGAIVLLLTKHYDIEIDFYRMFWYLSIFIAASCVAVWKLVFLIVRTFPIKESGSITSISNLSFGIYLCHILIMREILWNVSWIKTIDNYLMQTFIILILTSIFSILLCSLLSRLPFAQLLIGYKYLRK